MVTLEFDYFRSMKRSTLHFILLICFSGSMAYAQVVPLANAHAHNDYEHTRPLKDALSFGFTSVEADIYLINGELYVSHNYPRDLKGITLKELYLDPLQQLLKANSDKVYPNYKGVFYLMIDFKSAAAPTYQKLHELVSTYPEFKDNQNFKIYLSGQDLLYTLPLKGRIMAVDGRPKDVSGSYSTEEMPVISESFVGVSGWNTRDEITEEQWKKVKDFIDAVHKAGKKCRLWATPDNEKTWKRLQSYKMDFINTDKLKELSDFLKKS